MTAEIHSQKILTQLKQRFASEVLWHFASREKSDDDSYQILLSILKTGLHVGPQKEQFKVFNQKTQKVEALDGYPVACLADIPLKDLHIHAERYGSFAIGFHKASAILKGFNPVLYVNQYSSVFRKFMELLDEIDQNIEKSPETYTRLRNWLGSIAKSGDLMASPQADPKLDHLQMNNFYYEREWRSLSGWDFKSEDIALILLPEGKLSNFVHDRKNSGLNVSDITPVLPFNLIYNV